MEAKSTEKMPFQISDEFSDSYTTGEYKDGSKISRVNMPELVGSKISRWDVPSSFDAPATYHPLGNMFRDKHGHVVDTQGVLGYLGPSLPFVEQVSRCKFNFNSLAIPKHLYFGPYYKLSLGSGLLRRQQTYADCLIFLDHEALDVISNLSPNMFYYLPTLFNTQ